MENEKNAIVKKANGMITARYDMSLTQQKLIHFIIAKVRVSDEDFKDYDVPIPEFLAATGLSPEGIYTQIKTEAKAIMEKVIFLEKPNKTGNLEFKAFHWFSLFHYLTGSGTVQVRFDPVLKPYLLQLKKCFTTYSLAYVLGMRSRYSIRIYEALKMEAAFKGSASFDLETFKKQLQIDKLPGFEAYGHIKAKILGPALREIGTKTDLQIIGFKETKKGHKVIGFTIFFKPQPSPEEKAKEKERELALESLESSATSLSFLDPDALQFPEEKVLLDNIQ